MTKNNNPKHPKDLGIEFGTKALPKWKEILEVQKESVVANEINLEISKFMVELAERKIIEEKEKFK